MVSGCVGGVVVTAGLGSVGGAGGAGGVTAASSVASLGVIISGVGSAVVAGASGETVGGTADASCVGSLDCNVGGVESFALVFAVGLAMVIVPTGPGVAFDFTEEPMTVAEALMSLRIIPAALLGLVDELLREVPVKGTVLDGQSGTAFVGAGIMTVVPCIDCKRPVLLERPVQAVGFGRRIALIANPSEGLS